MKFLVIIIVSLILCEKKDDVVDALFGREIQNVIRSGVLNLNIFRCFVKNSNVCPHPDINFRMYTPKYHKGIYINIKNPLLLYIAGFNKNSETAFIVHGFNGTIYDKHLLYLRDAYLSRNYNVIMVDWKILTEYPCYLTAILNTKLASQCTAQLYAFLTHQGVLKKKITCIGHSLGAHICGMMTNYLTTKQHRIIGLDPARPLIERKKSSKFRLSRDDAHNVQIIHTNAGYLGQFENPGHLNYCVNGGRYQPYCKGHPIRRSRCSHFLSICYLANALFKHRQFLGVPCPNGCVALSGPNRLPVTTKDPHDITKFIKEFKIGDDAPNEMRGVYCIDIEKVKHCPFGEES